MLPSDTLENLLQHEWLETNGLGGFACGSVAGANTRRYHGLLTASLRPPVERYLLLSKLEETVVVGTRKTEISTNLYPGVVHPQGFHHLRTFQFAPIPTWTFLVAGIRIEKRVFLVDGENTVVIQYEVSESCSLEIRPLIAFRDYHSLTHANPALNPTLTGTPDGFSIEPYHGLPPLHVAHSATHLEPTSNWYHDFEYPREEERGLEFREDLFQPCCMYFTLGDGQVATIIASTGTHSAADAVELLQREINRRASLQPSPPRCNPLAVELLRAADQFIVKRGNLHSVIAGYPWFSDWGRDTMISLPGLALVTGRYEIAREILLAYSCAVDRGMIPNRFPDSGESPEYNTVDATLWMFEAVRQYAEATGDYQFIQANLYPTLKSIIDWHLFGTRHGIRCDADGLLSAGVEGVQLTWMDTKFTPRHGKAVEIQALWYNALRTIADLAQRFSDPEEESLAARIAADTLANFEKLFWNPESGCLFDRICPDGTPDPTMRPNQVLAMSLGYPMVDKDDALSILNAVERDLLTPFGLRTLAPSDPEYHPRHDSDAAYHQGTVWPWLLGPFIDACRRFRPDFDASSYLSAFPQHLKEVGLGSISETFDGDPPHRPTGCFAQAWSVAEILRAASSAKPEDYS